MSREALNLKSRVNVAQFILGSLGRRAQAPRRIVPQMHAARVMDRRLMASYAPAMVLPSRGFGRRRVLSAALIAAAAGGLIAWFAACLYHMGASAPSALGATIEEQRAEILRRATNIHILEIDGRRWYYVIGPLAPAWTLPSGPPCYVFDDAGNLVDWTADVGDSGEFRRRWPISASASPLSTEEASRIPWQ